LTFFGVKIQPSACLGVQVKIETKALSLVYLDPAHQALIDRILELKENGRNCRQIAEYLNDEGVPSWTGKRFYPALVFGVIRKARLKASRRCVEKIGNLVVKFQKS
jgi:CO dehydrogenase/acetyl-CoA synthase epsilon subunit